MLAASAPYDLIVIGGGPAGFFAALACAEQRPRSRILILEKAPAVLGKVRISGGGRCNVTHACFEPKQLILYYPRGAQALLGPFTRFQPADTVRWFETRGAPLKTELDGRIFPVSNRSQTIMTCLTGEAARHGVQVRTHARVHTLWQLPGGGFRIELDGEKLESRSVLLATGGDRCGMDLAAGLGHSIIQPVPSLFTFTLEDARLKGLPGVSVPDALLRLPEWKLEQRGAALITHWGLSGPAVLKLSAWGARPLHQAGYRAALQIKWLPTRTADACLELLTAARRSSPRLPIAAQSPDGILPHRLWKELALHAGVPEKQTWANASRAQMASLAGELSGGQYQIAGKGEFKEEFVTCGGVALDEVDFRTLQSKAAPGLFFAGEILDIDALTGGFNFQSAWTTGWIAGQAIARQS